MSKLKILIISAYNSSFVKNDINFLKEHFEVKIPDLVGRKKNLFDLLFSVITIFKGILWADVVYCWFADFKAFVSVICSKLMRKKAIVVIGGYEVANVPEINYGGMLSKKYQKRLRYILKNADRVLSISESSRSEILKMYKDSKINLIYNGVDCEKFFPSGDKQKIVLTVGNIEQSNLKRKGLETFVKTASLLPDKNFILIGKFCDESVKYLNSIATPNVTLTDYVPNEKLLEYFQEAKVYVQVSAHEGFGISLAEAMLCECVPVVTDRGAIPEVVGDTGFYVPFDDSKSTAEAIKEALNSNKGAEARQRILENFSLKKREQLLIEEIKGLL